MAFFILMCPCLHLFLCIFAAEPCVAAALSYKKQKNKTKHGNVFLWALPSKLYYLCFFINGLTNRCNTIDSNAVLFLWACWPCVEDREGSLRRLTGVHILLSLQSLSLTNKGLRFDHFPDWLSVSLVIRLDIIASH